MGKRIRADGDTWEAALEPETGGTEAAALVFHCISNPQRPYRVVPVPPDTDPDTLESDTSADPSTLHTLFERSQVMDFVHDPEADPHNRRPRTWP